MATRKTILENTTRKSPKQSRSLYMVETILDAATRVISMRPIEKVNTNLISQTAGISIGSLYQYFPNKEAIFAEIVLSGRRRLAKRIEETLAKYRDEDFEIIVLKLAEIAVEHRINNPHLLHQLERIEKTIELSHEAMFIANQIEASLAIILRKFNFVHSERLARDVTYISKGLINMSCLDGESDKQSLVHRVYSAVVGYLMYANDGSDIDHCLINKQKIPQH